MVSSSLAHPIDRMDYPNRIGDAGKQRTKSIFIGYLSMFLRA
jgi:hypothetical protein